MKLIEIFKFHKSQIASGALMFSISQRVTTNPFVIDKENVNSGASMFSISQNGTTNPFVIDKENVNSIEVLNLIIDNWNKEATPMVFHTCANSKQNTTGSYNPATISLMLGDH